MSTESSHRAFLLGMSEPESESRIEEAILGGRIDPGELELLEDELIDDYVLGRLSSQERRRFETHFLCNDEREQRLRVAHALSKVANDLGAIPAPSWRFRFRSRFGWTTSVPLTAALAASLLALAWVSVRDIDLSHALQQARRDADEMRIANQAQHATQISSESSQAVASAALPPPDLTLGAGDIRGPQPLPVMRIQSHQGPVRIDVELPAGLGGTFRVEVRAWDDRRVWSREFSVHHPIRAGESTTLVLPAQLLTPGNYRIWIGQVLSNGNIQSLDSHSIRVSR